MADLTRTEIAVLQKALDDVTFKNAVRVFAYLQAQFYSEQCVNEMREREPNNLLAAQHAGRVDVYSTLLNELEHFAKNQLANS